MPKTVYDPSDCDQFGNLDANLRFLEGTGVLPDAGRILEIGSGRGDLLAEFLRRRLRAVGIEPSAELARDAVAKHGPLPLARMFGDRLGFASTSFRLIVSFDVFEHIAASDAHLDEVARVLEAGGVYALQTPNKWTNSIFETIRWRSLTAWRVQHCALHSYVELRARFERHGFDVEFVDVSVVNAFYREKLRRYLGPLGPALLALLNPDRWPMRLRTNFFVVARLTRHRADPRPLPADGR